MSYLYTAGVQYHDANGRFVNLTQTPTLSAKNFLTGAALVGAVTITNIDVGRYRVQVTEDALTDVMFGVVPQIIPPFVSFTIYRWDINIRMSTIIGIVGGGGIGYILVQWIRNWKYQEAGIAVLFIAMTVAILDYVSAEIRERFT